MFMLAEYINMTTVSALATTLFLAAGAHRGRSVWEQANTGWWPPIWFVAKVWTFLFVFVGCALPCPGCVTTSSWRWGGSC